MNQQAAEVIAGAVDPFMVHPLEAGDAAEAVLAALEAAGLRIYRPDECELGQIDGVTFHDNPEGMDGLIVLVPSREHYATRQTVRLVPEAPDA